MIHTTPEKKLYEQHASGEIGHEVVDTLLPGGRLLQFEGFQFDYKIFQNSIHANEVDHHLHNVVRDVVAFYNSMGGYLFLIHGQDEDYSRYIYNAFDDCDAFNRKVASFIGQNIGVRLHSGNVHIDGTERRYQLLFVPKRSPNLKPSAFVKNSPNIGTQNKPKYTIKKGDIYCRYEHECLSAYGNVELLVYLFSERPPTNKPSISSEIESNLPARDPNLIQFIGRSHYIELLWQWVCIPRRPIKVLTAAGGLGKTTVAYEFATQVLDRPGSGFEKVVWLSGKKITYAPLLGKLVPTTRCDFENVDELLTNLLIETGTPLSKIEELDDIDDKVDCCIEALSTLSILLIIDDVDSLDKQQQNDLYSIIGRIIISANVNNDNSRVLFTSRLELLTGQQEKITMEGFEESEAKSYLRMVAEHQISDVAQRKKIEKHSSRIFAASAGSPIFIAAIVRLVSLGIDVPKAVSDWRGKNGEQVRAFTFEREIEQLSEVQREALYAMQLLSRARVSELQDICGVTSLEMEDTLSTLKEYHLYATKGDPVAGTILEVPEPIRMMSDITSALVPKERATQIERKCAQINANSTDPSRAIALVVSQTVRHWKNGDYEVAEAYLTSEIKKRDRAGELYCLRARTRLSIPSRASKVIETDFQAAERYGCSPFDLLKFWFIFKVRKGDWRGLANLFERKRSLAINFPVFNCAYVMSQLRLADAVLNKHTAEAPPYLDNAMSASYEFISEGHSSGYYHQLRALMVEAALLELKCIDNLSNEEVVGLDKFSYVVSLLDVNLAPSLLLHIGLEELDAWVALDPSRPAVKRQRSVLQDDLIRIVTYLEKQERTRINFVERANRIRAAI